VGLAAESIELSAPARAIDLLDPIVRARPGEPYGVLALAYLTQGEAFAALGDRDRALASFAHAIDSAPHDDPEQIRARARAAAAKVRSRR
jgi:tetratricopeptide (TPR) repeat protein